MYFRLFIITGIIIVIYIVIYILSLYLSAGARFHREGFESALPNDPYASKLHKYYNFSITEKPGNSEKHPVYTWMENKKKSIWKPLTIGDYKAKGLIDSTLSSTKTTAKSLNIGTYDDSYKYCSGNPSSPGCTLYPSKETLERISSNKPL